jgi:hypothetical protein
VKWIGAEIIGCDLNRALNTSAHVFDERASFNPLRFPTRCEKTNFVSASMQAKANNRRDPLDRPAKRRESNFSALLDGLLAAWLG